MIRQDDLLTLVPEKPAAGGRMLARHEGMVVLVAGAIPGEFARVRIERVDRSLAFGRVVEPVEPHASRRAVDGDPRCGGSVLAHIVYEEQCRLKGAIIADALIRVGRIPIEETVGVVPSPEAGYRMRARLHLRAGRIGFFLEGTHQLCDAGMTRQLLPETTHAAGELARRLAAAGYAEAADVEVSENRAGDQRAMHIDLTRTGALRPVPPVGPIDEVTGISWCAAGGGRPRDLFGQPYVEDVVQGVRLRRHARAFFQGNRYLLDALVSAVVTACAPGPVVDLYAGVGLLGLSVAAGGGHQVVAVEGDDASADDLEVNAAPLGSAVRVERTSVERFVARPRPRVPFTLVLDPPRTGMTRDAAAGAIAMKAGRVVFVSCDVATLARDLRRFLDAGYRLDSVQGFDLFPNTSHVETLACLSLR
ncbi:MAG: TRAM domain-containing protein [Vicinamibacterales bacterium]